MTGRVLSGLQVEDLTVRRGPATVLGRVSFAIAPGEVVAIAGPSGAGKTTLLRAVAGLLPYGGTIRQAARPALVFQQHALAARLTAAHNVLVGTLARVGLLRSTLRLWPAAERALADSCLAQVGLHGLGPRRADQLSGGQRQRVAVARALAQQAPVLLADEPVASLDPANAEAILTLLTGLARQHGIALLLCLHQPDLARRFADRHLHLEAGRLVERAPEGGPAMTDAPF